MTGLAKSQQIQTGDGPGAHREDVAQNAADPGRRALIGFDERRVVVALHLEDAGVAVADVDHAGVLAGAANHPGGLGRQLAQMNARRLVGTVFVPHGREDAQLGKARGAADQLEYPLIFVGLEPVRGGEFGVDLGFGAISHPQ